MRYVSTRGLAPATGFDEALLAGLAPDGGLYVPQTWPRIAASDLAEATFQETAAIVLAPLVSPWIGAPELLAMLERAFSSFDCAEVVPLVQMGEEDFLLELFHGPTLAFKDIAMQALGLMFDRALAERGARATIVGATSGDTGGAAVEAFRGREQVDLFILHPAGRVSDVQRRMMTTAEEDNVCNIAVEGTFDDCQRIVKGLFRDADFSKRVRLSGVNSINWARLAVQSVYYFTALEKLGGAKTASFCVPTGNFGDAFAGYAAKCMGAKVRKIAVAVNRNDILRRALASGVYRPEGAHPTTSPAMDIQVASNFERLLFEASGRDAAALRGLMEALDAKGGYDIPADWLRVMRETFESDVASEAENRATIARVHREIDMLIDPHSAVGVAVAAKLRAAGRLEGPVITLATAHPAKFPEAVEAASGATPLLPARLDGLLEKPERIISAPADAAVIRELLLSKSRAAT
ncbi:MAG: threonine synthase [Amphiplicatus sp.]